MSTWADYVGLYWYYVAIDPRTKQVLGYASGLRSGVAPPSVEWAVSDPQVLELRASQIRPRRAGQANVMLMVDGSVVAEQTVTVSKPSVTQRSEPISIGKDLQSGLGVSFSLGGGGIYSGMKGVVTARSTDPSKLILSGDPADRGRESITVPITDRGGPAIYAQALASEGRVPVILTSPEFEGEVAVDVILEPAVLRWGKNQYVDGKYTLQGALSLEVSREPVSLSLALQGQSETGALQRRPGVPPLSVTLVNSDPRVVEVNRITAVPGSSLYSLTALAAGSAVLTLTSSDDSIRIVNPDVTVDVRGGSNSAVFQNVPPSVTVGKDLTTGFNIRLFNFGALQPGFEAVSDDPALVLVSTSPTTPGAARAAFSAKNDSYYDVYVQGLKSSGETIVRLRAEGAEEKRIRVSLLPSGPGISGSQSGNVAFPRQAAIVSYMLDPTGAIGISQQGLQPGKTMQVRVTAEGAPIRLAADSVTLSNASPAAQVGFTPPASGATAAILVEADGYPAAENVARYIVSSEAAPPFSKNLTLVRDTQIPFTPGLTGAFKITSSDPSKLLASSTPSQLGSGSLQTTLDSSSVIWLQALSDSGVVKLRLEKDGVVAGELNVSLEPVRVTVEKPQVAVGATAAIKVSSNQPAAQMRPGAAVLRVSLRPANTSILSLDPAEVQLNGGDSSVRVTGKSAGATELLIDVSPDWVYTYSRITAVVAASSLAERPTLTIGKNLQGSMQLSFGSAMPSAAIVTITSSDPSKLVLSRTGGVAGSESINVAVTAGQMSTPSFTVQALAGEGDVVVRVSAGGPAVEALLHLVPSWVVCTRNFTTVPLGGSVDLSCMFDYTGKPTSYAAALQLGNLALRAGLPDLSVAFDVSPAGVVALTPEKMVLRAGGDSFGKVAVNGIAVGEADIRVLQPDGFGPGAGSDLFTTNVTLSSIPIATYMDNFAVGGDTQRLIEFKAPSGTPVTVTSADPARLIVGTNPKDPGSSSATANATSQTVGFYLQALQPYGTVEILVSAPGFATTRVPVVLVPVTFSVSLSTGGSTITLRKGDVANIAVGVKSRVGSFGVRPGAQISVELSTSPAGVVSLEISKVAFAPNESTTTVPVKAISAGSTLIRAKAIDGTDATGSPISVTVTP